MYSAQWHSNRVDKLDCISKALNIFQLRMCYLCSEDIVREAFSPYGFIEDIRIFEEKGYAFIKYVPFESIK